MITQGQFTNIYNQRPQNFVWFLGAGASRSSGLPTATDIIWDLKRRYYCAEENQKVSRQDIQNESVKNRIQSFMDSKGFPELWSENEYSIYFEKIFGDNKERQRKYLNGILSEEHVSLSVGNRVLAALITSELSRIVFTTNFDSVVEMAIAEIGNKSIAAFHLEGSHAANQALNNEEFPLYCKLHGDFRYDSIKNLTQDLATQNAELSTCLINAGNRYGFVVAGYSGRDKSIIELFYRVLESENPFPHGLFWTNIKGSPINPNVEKLLTEARNKGVNADYIEIETFDTLMLRLWRNLESVTPELDEKVRKAKLTNVNIELPSPGRGKPLLRFNGLPIISIPTQCFSLSFNKPKDWSDLRQASIDSDRSLILTKSDTVWCWGEEEKIKNIFGSELDSITTRDIPTNIHSSENLHIKGFLEEALCLALVKDKSLLLRIRHSSAYLIVNSHAVDVGSLDPLFNVVGKTDGTISGLFTSVTPEHAEPEPIRWSECVRISIDIKNDKFWLLLEPDIWIWPPRSRQVCRDFLSSRRSSRRNDVYNNLIDAWVNIILGTDERNLEIPLSTFHKGTGVENPSFCISSRTGFSKRLI